jgi:tetratricopeptide (TPR) repeat protein
MRMIIASEMNKKYTYLIIVLLILASLLAFGRIQGNDFVNFDDNLFITDNAVIQSGFNAESIKWAFTTAYMSYWHPLTWLSIMLDWRLFGANASGHHLVSLLWHIGSAILLFLFLSKTTGSLWPSAFAAAFFALHPLRVESVAWAGERKDVLSVFFGMATIYAYSFYAEKPKLSKYFLSLILFVLALMSKPMMVTLPCVLFLLDYWPLNRLQKVLTLQSVTISVAKGTDKGKSENLKAASSADKKIVNPFPSGRQLVGKLLWEKVPFFSLALALIIALIVMQKSFGGMASLEIFPFSVRIKNAIISYVAYLEKTFWPVDLAVFYPYQFSLTIWQVVGAAMLLLAISTIVICLARKAPFLVVGWFLYLGVLFPVIGITQAGDQAMADRYSYFPSVGIAIMVTWGVAYLMPKEKLRNMILIPVAVIILAILTFLTWQQCGYWKNSSTLFNHVLKATKANYLAHHNFATSLVAEGKMDEAISHYYKSIELNPILTLPHTNLARALVAQGRIDAAIAAIKLNPNQENAHSILGLLLAAEGKKLAAEGKKLAAQTMNEEAIKLNLAAIRINPDNAETHLNLGAILAAQERNEEAIVHYLAAIKINPKYDDAYYNLANLYIKQRKIEEAIDNYLKAIQINPDHVDAHCNLADVFVKQNKLDQAIEHFREAVRISPYSFTALNNLGVNLEKQLRHEEAIKYYRRAVKILPENPGIYFNLGVALGNKGDLREAAENFRQAVNLKPDYEEARRALKIALEMK